MTEQDSLIILVPEGADALRHTLDTSRPRLLAIADSSVRFPWVTSERARDQSRSLLAAWTQVATDAEAMFAAPYFAQLAATAEELPTLIGIFWASDLNAGTPQTPPTKAERDALVVAVRKADARLTRWMVPAIEELGTDDERATALSLRPGNGYQDDANDVVGWVSIALGNPKIGALLPISKDELLSMQTTALRHSALLGNTDQRKGSPSDLRNRAYTLWADAFERLERNARHVAAERNLPVTFEKIHMPASKPDPKSAPPDAPESIVTEEPFEPLS